MVLYKAELNPEWPGKGQRKWCVYRTEGAERVKISVQFNKENTAKTYAYECQVREERKNRPIYLGD